MALGRTGEALLAYEAVLKRQPNRLNSMVGAGLAAERAGDAEKADSYYKGAVDMALETSADAERLSHTKGFLT